MDCDETEDFVGTSSNDNSDVEDDAEQSTEIADMIRRESGMMVLLLKEVDFTSENASLALWCRKVWSTKVFGLK